MPDFTTIVEALYEIPADDRLTLTFLPEGTPCGAVTWNRWELLDEIDRYATALLERGVRPGDRVVLASSPGLEFIAALYGTMVIGAAVVTTFPPRREKDVDRFGAIIRDCDATVVLVDDAVRGLLGQPADRGFTVLCPSDVARVDTISSAVRTTMPGPDDTALIQYTSGSTGHPKGVVVTHQNLVSNTVTLRHYFGDEQHSVFTWLPPYHDMGLIGTLIYPIYHGYPVVGMAPLHFIQNPLRWLSGVSHYGCDITMGPNFALDLCVREARQGESLAGIDLGRLRALACGSEPVLESTLRRFLDTFTGLGFDPNALPPAYGQAEATLFVSGKKNDVPYRTLDGGEVFVLGRMDDLIIINGRNIYPQDVEAAIATAHPEIVKVAVVGMDEDGAGRLGVLAETAARDAVPADTLELAVRETVVGQFGINPLVIRIGARRTVPTTTSGQPRRCEVRRLLRAATEVTV